MRVETGNMIQGLIQNENPDLSVLCGNTDGLTGFTAVLDSININDNLNISDTNIVQGVEKTEENQNSKYAATIIADK